MKFYNPLNVALKKDDTILGVFTGMSIVFTAVGTIVLVTQLFGAYGLLLFPVITIGRVLYAVFTGK